MTMLLRRWHLLETAETRRFYGYVLALGLVLLGLPFAYTAVMAGQGPGLLLPAMLALVLSVSFLFRRAETLLTFAIYVLFYETIALWTTSSVKHVDELTVPVLFLITLITARSRLIGFVRPWRDGAVLLIVAAALASSLVNHVPPDIWIPALLLLVKGILFFYVALLSGIQGSDLRRMVVVVAAIGVVVLVLGGIEFFNPPAFQHALGLRVEEQVRGGIVSIKSIFFHPVLFGWFTAFAGLFSFAYYSVFRRWWQLGLAVAFSAGSILSGRRKAIVGAGGALILGAIAQRIAGKDRPAYRRTWLTIAGSVAVLVILFLPYFADLGSTTAGRYLPPSGGAVSTTAPAPSGSGGTRRRVFAKGTPPRVALYIGSIDVARDYFPLGAGLGRYGSYLSAVHFSPLYERYGLTTLPGLRPKNPSAVTDTFWPQILGELGVFGLLAYVAFIASLVWEVVLAMRRAESLQMRAFVFGALLVLLEALAESLAAPMFAAPSATYMVLGVVALSIASLGGDGAAPSTRPA